VKGIRLDGYALSLGHSFVRGYSKSLLLTPNTASNLFSSQSEVSHARLNPPANMEQIDYEMRDTVMDSTEINGHHDTSTVDPSIISLNGHNLQMPPIRERLPIHSHGQSLKSTSVFSMSSTHQSNSLPGAVASASHSRQLSLDSETDEMDIESSAPPIVEVRMPPPPRFPPLPYATKRTGLVYDSRMRLHVEPVSMAIRENDIHPEDPRRIHEIFQEIQQAGLVQGAEDPEEEASDEQCWRIHARPASKAEICLVHNPSHYEFIYSLQGTSRICRYISSIDRM
jgi:histone deacetylase 6